MYKGRQNKMCFPLPSIIQFIVYFQALVGVHSKTSSYTSVQLSQSLQTVGAIDARLAHAESTVERMEQRLTAVELLSHEVNRVDHFLHLLSTRLERIEAKVDTNQYKNAIYFDAFRYS